MGRGDVLRSASGQTKERPPIMKSAIIVFPGSNRERDMAMALTAATGRAPALVWHKENELPPVDLIVLPGGFSHGDYLRAGAMAARAPSSKVMAKEHESAPSALRIEAKPPSRQCVAHV